MKPIEQRLIDMLRKIVTNEAYDNFGNGSSYYEARKLLDEYDKENKS